MRLKQIEAAKMNSAVPHIGTRRHASTRPRSPPRLQPAAFLALGKWVYEQVGGGSKEAAEAKARHFLDTSRHVTHCRHFLDTS